MRRLLLASAFLVAGFPALAADLPPYSQAPYYEPAPIFTWTGAYVGASAAFGFGNFTHDGAPFFGDADGGLFGIQAGYNYQSGPLVAGIEGDLNFGSVSGSNHPFYNSYANGNINGEGSIRARFGYAFNHTMVYITGGYTGANLKGALTDFSISPNSIAWRGVVGSTSSRRCEIEAKVFTVRSSPAFLFCIAGHSFCRIERVYAFSNGRSPATVGSP